LTVKTFTATTGWLFSIEIGNTGIVMESVEPEGYFKFVVPGMT